MPVRIINSLCYSKPWQSQAVINDYQEGVVDTKTPVAILDSYLKYQRRCKYKGIALIQVGLTLCFDRLKVDARLGLAAMSTPDTGSLYLF